MKTFEKETAVKTILNVTFGTAHFIVQSSADLLVNTEGYIANKVLNSSKQEYIKSRKETTGEYQQKVLSSIDKAKQRYFKCLEQAKNQLETI